MPLTAEWKAILRGERDRSAEITETLNSMKQHLTSEELTQAETRAKEKGEYAIRFTDLSNELKMTVPTTILQAKNEQVAAEMGAQKLPVFPNERLHLRRHLLQNSPTDTVEEYV
jgi:hypothetical protein